MNAIVVGHSSASALVADLATKLPARGIIIVDGDVPPSRGAAVPGQARPSRLHQGPCRARRHASDLVADGLRAIRGGCRLSVWIFWRATRRHLRGSKADFRGCTSAGSTTRSNSPIGSISLLVSSRLQRSMITQPLRRNGAAGQSRTCTARICIRRFIQQRRQTQFSRCRVNLFPAGSISATTRKRRERKRRLAPPVL